MATILENVNTLSVHLEDAYTALEGKGATIPQQKNATNLSATVDSLPAAGFTIDDLLGTTAKDLVVKVTEIPAGATSQSGGGAYNLFAARNVVSTADFPNLVKVNDNSCNQMFQNCTSITKLKSLPATTLASNCYSNMFKQATNLRSVPAVLPATTLAESCYSNMFYNCTSLTSTPALPASVLKTGCYSNMFYGCTALTTTSPLPATTLASNCYSSMFRGCTSLTTAPSLSAATNAAASSFSSMFNGCTSISVVPDMPQGINPLQSVCYYMFFGCTAIAGAPVVKVNEATKIANQSFQAMFQNCPNLTKVTLDFTLFQSVPSLVNVNAVNVFNDTADTRLEIRVPAALEASWKTATNWSTWASFIVGV